MLDIVIIDPGGQIMDAVLFRKSLEALENGAELLEFFDNSIKAEISKGVSLSHRANQDNVKYKKVMQRLGWDGTVELDEFASTLLDTIDGKQTLNSVELSDLNSKLAKLQRAFDQSQNELKTEKEQREVLQRQNKIKTIEGKLIPKLSEDLNGASILVKALLSDGILDLDDSGEIIVKEGDKSYGYDDGVKYIVGKHIDLRKNKQQPGAGSGSTNVSGTINKPKYTMEQLKSMTPEQAASDIKNYNESMNAYKK